MAQQISHHEDFPRGPLVLTGLLVAVAVLMIVTSHLGNVGTMPVPVSDPVASRDLYFADRSDGAVVITDARTGDEVAVLAPQTNGFIRSVMRGLVRERMMNGLGREQPFRLVRRSDGRLSLVDPATSRAIELVAFGPTNAQAFAVLFPERSQ